MCSINGQKNEQFKYSVNLAASHLEGEFWGRYMVSSLLASEDMITFQTMLILWNNLLKQRNFFCITGGEGCILCSKPGLFFLILFISSCMTFPQWRGTIVSIHFLQIYFKCIRSIQNVLFYLIICNASFVLQVLSFALALDFAWSLVWRGCLCRCLFFPSNLSLAVMFFSLGWQTTCNSKWHSLSDIWECKIFTLNNSVTLWLLATFSL